MCIGYNCRLLGILALPLTHTSEQSARSKTLELRQGGGTYGGVCTHQSEVYLKAIWVQGLDLCRMEEHNFSTKPAKQELCSLMELPLVQVVSEMLENGLELLLCKSNVQAPACSHKVMRFHIARFR